MRTCDSSDFEVGRFKTGTPCRLNARSIDFSRCAIQLGDEPAPTFAFDPAKPASDAHGEIFTLNRVRDGKFHVEQLTMLDYSTTPRPMRSSAQIFIDLHFTPEESKARVHGTAHQLKTKWSSFSIKLLIRFFWSQKDGIRRSST